MVLTNKMQTTIILFKNLNFKTSNLESKGGLSGEKNAKKIEFLKRNLKFFYNYFCLIDGNIFEILQ